jgi:hypothetical protein
MKPVKLYEEFVNEATTSWRRMMKGVKAGNTGPWSLVAIENYKVVAQNVDIRIMDIIPAYFEKMRKDYPKADIHIEDATGAVVWNESLKVDESFINEDSSMAFFILMQAAIVNGILIGQMANSGGGGSFHPIDDLKAWWQKRKSDKAVKSIIDKIKDDKDVIEFMKLTPSQQRGKFRSLIATKLTDDELEYLNKINRKHFQSESLNEAVFKYTEDDINMTAGFYGTLEQEYDEKKVQKMYLQAIEDLKKAYKTTEETAIKILDSREGRHFADFIVSKTTKPSVVDAMAAYFGSAARLYNFIGSIKEGKIVEGTYNSSKEIAIYDGEDGLTHIEKRGKGYYGYNDEFDFEATDKADLEKKLKSWKYKLISGSIDEAVINEAKQLDRDEMMVHLEDKYKFPSVKTTEEFDGAEGGIWVSGENGVSLGGKRIYNYYGEGSAYDLGVLKKYEDAINKLGWYSEWYDAGTVMIWPN